ncbi:hypothetical protein QZH41_005115 [Actinostola sp. cb2023]|nr:hypothetical protein QZH41_005115 [Actinostola sp. cb2023]
MKTPLIMAAGRELSAILLLGIILCYVLAFVRVVMPTAALCGLRRFGTGFAFCLCYSSLLVKTNRIARIFSGTKSPSYISPKSQLVITTLVLFPQVGIALAELLLVVPKTKLLYTYSEYVLITCGVDTISVVVQLCYNVVLILLCTYYAFYTRKTPLNFNEAKFIGFCMYTTCVVWIAFLPMYFGMGGGYEALAAVSVSLTNKPSICDRGEVYGRDDAYKRPVSRLGSARIKINVRGMVFETYEETLAQYPQTLLGDPSKRVEYFDPVSGHYCFDRNKFIFDSILFFYQSHGILAFPEEFPKESFIDEIRFFQLEEVDERIKRDIDPMKEEPKKEILPENNVKKKIWLLFEYPDSSLLANLLAKLSVIMIIASTVTFCLETVDSLSHVTVKVCANNDSFPSNLSNESLTGSFNETNNTNNDCYRSEPRKIWKTFEAIFVAWFTLEYFMRLVSAPNVCKFVRSVMGLIDVLAILPYYMTAISRGSVSTIPVLGIIRLLRIVRLLKLSRYSQGLKMLAKTLLLSATDLPSMFIVMIINVILFSSIVFHVELDRADSDFKSIPDAFWWSVITMTTVGYGDQVPKGIAGKLVGAFCAVSGIVILFCFPAPILLSHFEHIYSLRDKQKERKKKEKKKDVKNEENFSVETEFTHVTEAQKSPSMQRG